MSKIYIDIFVVLFIGIAGVIDIKTKKIPNFLIIIFSCIGIYLRTYDFLINFLVSILILFLFFKLNFFGAGDIKLISVLSGYLGLKQAFIVSFIALSMASVYALYYLLKKNILFERIKYFFEYITYVLRDKTLYKYNGGLNMSLTMVMAPYFLVAFIIVSLFEIWKAL